jgi:uncharacterized delta-60 repeat protein
LRARAILAAIALVGVGCSVVLGIDGTIIDPTPDASAPSISIDKNSVALRQGGTATLNVSSKSGAGRLVQVTPKGLPPGITAPTLSFTEGDTKPLTLTADDLAARGDFHLTLEGTTGDLAAIPIALDVRVDGNLDTSFGDGGLVVVPFGPPFGPSDGEPIGLAVDAQGRILVAWGVGDPGVNNVRPLAVTRLDSEGKLDSTFGDAGWVTPNIDGGTTPNQRAQSLAIMPDGTLVVVGRSAELAGKTEGVIVVLDPNGSLVAGEKVDAAVTSTVSSAVAIESAQSVLALGQADSYGILSRVFTADGTFDPTYGEGGVATVEAKDRRVTTCHDVSITSDRTLTSCRTSQSAFTLLAFLPDSGLDLTFGVAGASPGPVVNGTAQEPWAHVLAGDRIAQAGVASGNGLSDRVEVRVVSSLGIVDSTFGDGGIATYEPQRAGTTGAEAFSALVVDGGLFVGGALEIGTNRRALVMRIDLDGGAVDNSFGAEGVSSVTWPEVIVVRRLAMQGNRLIAAALARRYVQSTPTFDVVLFRYAP